MNCAASAAHAVILMVWTSDCQAGDYRQLLYPARWRQYRLLPNRLRRRAAWCDWFVWCGPVVCSCVGFATCPRVVCPGYVEKGGGTLVVSPPCEVWVRRRATLPHPSGCSTIAVPGLSFRVRNGSGRLPWAMAAANLVLYIPRDRVSTCSLGGSWRVGDRIVDATEGMIHVTCRVSPCRPVDACSCHP